MLLNIKFLILIFCGSHLCIGISEKQERTFHISQSSQTKKRLRLEKLLHYKFITRCLNDRNRAAVTTISRKDHAFSQSNAKKNDYYQQQLLKPQKSWKPLLVLLYASVALTCNIVTWDQWRKQEVKFRSALSFCLLSVAGTLAIAKVIYSDPGFLPFGHPHPPSQRWCQKCRLYKPGRAHHCRRCGRCIERMDHHCSYLSNCVGRKNLSSYLCMLGLGFATSVHGCSLAAVWLLEARRNGQGLKLFYGCWTMIALLFPLGAFAAALLCIQAYGLWTDSTTIERWLASGDKDYVQNVAVLER